jgi:hypothetical protein
MPTETIVRHYSYEDWEGVWAGYKEHDWDGMVCRGVAFPPPPVDLGEEDVKPTTLSRAGMPPNIGMRDSKRCAHSNFHGFNNYTEVTITSERPNILQWSALVWGKAKITLRPRQL